MSKVRLKYLCQECGYQTPKWLGKCPDCGAWSSFEEEREAQTEGKFPRSLDDPAKPIPISQVETDTSERIPLPFEEVNRVLGGGLTNGSVVLLAGDPGIGKSTLLIQLLGKLAQNGFPKSLLYVSGEESARQLRLRAERLSVTHDRVLVLAETDVDMVLKAIEETKPAIVIVDSIQTLYSSEVASIPGSISQVKEVSDRLVRHAKKRNISTIIVGHVTKEGSIAGPRALEHLVDTVLFFEGERQQSYRLLRSVKNRFGPTDEIGVFEMRQEGLCEVEQPSEIFLKDRPIDTPGSVVFPAMEGTRPLLIEIQGLVSKAAYGTPIRSSIGFDKNRLNMLLAVLEKKAGLEFSSFDVHVNLVGGVKLSEPGVDLAVCCSLVSSYFSRPFPPRWVAFGEVGLAGEVRNIPRSEARMKEAQKMGFQAGVGPKGTSQEWKNFSLHSISSVDQIRKWMN